jgi:hypothetical protein
VDLCDSVVLNGPKLLNHGDTERAEVAQRKRTDDLFNLSPSS